MRRWLGGLAALCAVGTAFGAGGAGEPDGRARAADRAGASARAAPGGAADDRALVRQGFGITPLRAATSPLRIDGETRVAYELLLVNFSAGPLAVTAVGTIDGGRRRAIGDAVAKPAATAAPDGAAVAPGGTTVLYLDHPLTTTRLAATIGFRGPDGRDATVEVPIEIAPSSKVVLGPPLSGGPWVAVYDPGMARGHRRVVYAVDGVARIPGRFAIDWVKVDAEGRPSSGTPTAVTDYYGYGAAVLAVADATVAAVRDDVPDATDGEPAAGHALGEAAGNYVALELGDGNYAFYEHLKPGSIGVKVGDRVVRGQRIAALGNSGDTTGPHLHFHLADANATLAADGVPYALDRYRKLGAYPTLEAFGAGGAWDATSAGERRRELPGPNAVVAFE